MDFVQAIKSCLGQYATFSGRASRSEYWWFFLFQVLVMLVASMVGDVVYGLASLALFALVLDLDVGFIAMTVAVVLALASPKAQKGAINQISWSTVLLIGGVLTFVGVLQEAGTVEYVGDSVASIGIPLLVALLLCYIGAIVSAFASSTAIEETGTLPVLRTVKE